MIWCPMIFFSLKIDFDGWKFTKWFVLVSGKQRLAAKRVTKDIFNNFSLWFLQSFETT